jgi:hypothetical protein
VRADDWPTPTRISGELLTSHPEAGSLLAEAGHRQALPAWSTADTGTKFTWLRPPGAATKGYGTGSSRAGVRSVPFDAGLLVLGVAGTGLAMLDLVELSGLSSWAGTGAARAGGYRGRRRFHPRARGWRRRSHR